jgi:hypothetical protein
MIRFEMVCYLFASLVLAWGGGWFFIHEYGAAVVLCCAIWSAVSVWLLARGVQAVLRSQRTATSRAETGIDAS